MLDARYRNDGSSIIPLRWKQRKAKTLLLERIKTKYKFFERPCVCSSSQFEILSEKDAFGIPQSIVICKTCGLIQVSPCLQQESYADFYQYVYPQLYGDNNNMADLFLDLLERGNVIYDFIKYNNGIDDNYLNSKKIILEIGCSVGGILEVFRTNGHETYGVDYDSEVVAHGVGRGLNLYCGNARQLGSEFIEKFDIIILSHIFEHITDIAIELDVIRGLLRKTGMLYVEVPGIYSSLGQVQSDFLDFIEFDHVYYFGLNTLEQTLRLFGFRMVAGEEHDGQAIRAVFSQIQVDEPYEKSINDRRMLINYYNENMARLKHLEENYSKNKFKHFAIRQLKFLPLRYKLKLISAMKMIGFRAR